VVINGKIKYLGRKVLWLSIAEVSMMYLYGVRETIKVLAKKLTSRPTFDYNGPEMCEILIAVPSLLTFQVAI
jgi:hypothetical protein